MSNNKQILAIWGSPSSGKTVTSIKIAMELARRKKNVVVVLADIICPAISTILPNCKVGDRTLGALLSESEISQDSILARCIPIDKNPYISLLGYKNRDNVYTYSAYGKERATDLLVLLRHIADYVIIDCSSIITANILSAISLEVADSVLRLGSCDIKGISYFLSHLPLIEDQKFGQAKHVKALSNVKLGQDSAEYSNFYGGDSYVVPYVADLEEQYFSAKLLDGLKSKEGRKYERVINSITEEVFAI
jgi:MinD-like ATPase involved in chromosome partitioning or flagellar assembly